MSHVVSHAACRADLAGGTLDLWPLYLYFGGLELVHMAINVQAKAELHFEASKIKGHRIHISSLDLNVDRSFSSLQELKNSLQESTAENPLRWLARLSHYFLSQSTRSGGDWSLQCSSQAPAGSGLGGSSVLGVAVSKAFEKMHGRSLGNAENKWRLQKQTRDLEAVEIEHPAGDQDYVPALFGGLLIFKLDNQRRSVEQLPRSLAKRISAQTALLYTGVPHHSGLNNWQVFKAYHEGDAKVRKALGAIRDISAELASELRKGSLKKLAPLINDEWAARKLLSSSVNAPALEKAWAFGKRHGAIARKACGAGGGGCLLLVFPDEASKIKAIRHAIPNSRWKWLDTSPDY